MSEPVKIALIAAIPGILATLATLIVGLINRKQIIRLRVDLDGNLKKVCRHPHETKR